MQKIECLVVMAALSDEIDQGYTDKMRTDAGKEFPGVGMEDYVS